MINTSATTNAKEANAGESSKAPSHHHFEPYHHPKLQTHCGICGYEKVHKIHIPEGYVLTKVEQQDLPLELPETKRLSRKDDPA